jgi:hypothetical protein
VAAGDRRRSKRTFHSNQAPLTEDDFHPVFTSFVDIHFSLL